MNSLTVVESNWELDDLGNAIITIALPTDEVLAYKMCDSWYNQLRETNKKPQIAFHLQGRGDFVTTPFEDFANLPARTSKKQGTLVKLKQIQAEPNAPDYCYIFITDHTENRYYLGNNEWDKEQFLIQLPEKASPPTPEERAERLRRQADEAFDRQDFSKAEELYNKILALPPNSHTAHARTRLQEIQNNKIAEQERQKVEEIVGRMKQAFDEQKYEDCLALCDQISNHAHATGTQKDLARRYRLECEEKLKERKLEADLLAYHNLIATADRLFSEAKRQESLKFYKGALNLRPQEAYPKEQIKRIEEMLRAERRKKGAVLARFAGVFLLLGLLVLSGWYFLQSKPVWEAVQARKVLRVGVHTYSPIDKDKFAEKIAQDLVTLAPELKGINVQTVADSDFKNLADRLKNGELDMAFYAGMGQNDVQNLVCTVEGYWHFDKVVAFLGEAKKLEDFTGKLVEIHEKDRSISQLQIGWKFEKMTNGKSAYLAGDKKFAGLICDLPTCLQLRKQFPNLQYLRIKGYEGRFSIFFKNTNGSMRDEIDKLLLKLKQTPNYKELVEKFEQ